MGRSLAASVPWSQIKTAIATNSQASHGLLSGKSAMSATASLPADIPVPWLPAGWREDTTCSIGDIVSFALWIRDPMYRTATTNIRRAMEMEEAAALLHAIDAAWKDNKSRGWVRKHLEEDLRDRAAGVAAPPDAWESVRSLRRAAMLVDYVCIQKGIRVALWWPDCNTVTCIPCSPCSPCEMPSDAAEPSAVVYNLNCTTGKSLVGLTGAAYPAVQWTSLHVLAKSGGNGFTWIPPACAPSIGSLTVAAIYEQIIALKADEPKIGGRIVLWNRLQWLRLCKSLEGEKMTPPNQGL